MLSEQTAFGTGEQCSLECAYRSGKKPLRFVDPEELADAFLHCEKRKVDKSRCISFMNREYEVGLPLIGCTVDVVFDPADIMEHLGTVSADASRLLTAAEERNRNRKAQQVPAVAYRRVRKEDRHV